MSYTVTRHPHGIVVTSPVPVGDACVLMRHWASEGWDLVDSLIAAKLHASLVVTTHAEATVWRAELGIDVPLDLPQGNA